LLARSCKFVLAKRGWSSLGASKTSNGVPGSCAQTCPFLYPPSSCALILTCFPDTPTRFCACGARAWCLRRFCLVCDVGIGFRAWGWLGFRGLGMQRAGEPPLWAERNWRALLRAWWMQVFGFGGVGVGSGLRSGQEFCAACDESGVGGALVPAACDGKMRGRWAAADR